VFKLSGFSPEELEQRHIVFEVLGKNNQRKDVIGKVVIGGSKGKGKYQIFTKLVPVQ